MLMNINEFLDKWKSESLFGERQFKKLDSLKASP